jgi:hypothetical protein
VLGQCVIDVNFCPGGIRSQMPLHVQGDAGHPS